MKSKGFIKGTICLLVWVLFFASVSAWAATIEVSQPTYATSNQRYDRNPCVIYDGTNYWLFYTKGDQAAPAVRGQGGYDPDADNYVVYYKTASTIDALAGASETKLDSSETYRPANFDQRVVSATYFNSKIYAFVSSGQSGIDRGLYYYEYSGGTWVGPRTLIADGTARGGHVNVASDDDRVYIVWESSDGSSDCYTWDGTNLNPKVDISDGNQPKITLFTGKKDVGVLYVVNIEDGTGDIEVFQAATDPQPGFGTHSTAIPGAGLYDPCIFNDGTNLYVVTAPYIGAEDRQYLVQAKCVGTSSSWLAAKTVSYGGHSGTAWWDYWPCGYHDGDDAYIFLTTETSSPTYGDGEIAYIKMEWDLGNDHYFYIQNAVDQAVSGDVVNVAAETYNEDVQISKGLTLTTAGKSGATIDGGIWIKDLHTFTNPITVENFTIENGTSIDATHDYGIKISGDIGAGADQAIVDMHIVNNTLVNCGKTDDVTTEMWWNAAIFFDVNHFGAMGSRYDTYFPGTGEISHNTIVNNLGDPNQRTQLGIGVRSGRNMKINYNGISGNVAEGIHHWGPVNTTSTGNYEIDHNTIDLSGWIGDRIGNNPRGIWSYAPQSSVSYNTIISKWIGMVLTYWDDTYWGGGTAGPNYGLTVSQNVIHPPAKGAMSVGLRISGNNSQITDNEIYGATDNVSGYGAGLMFEGWGHPEWGERTECAHNTFERNYIHDNYDGIYTWDPPYNNTSDNLFRYNSVENNTNYGLYNGNDTTTVNASGNWWGDNDPSVVGGTISDNADYTPWLHDGTDQSGDPGFQPDLSGLWVDDDSPQTGTTGRIQEAVDLVTASTINVAPGVYDGSIVFASGFDKDGLILRGDVSDRPVITGGVRFLQTATIDGITFENLYIKGLADGANMIFDMDNSGTVNDFVMDSCVLDGENVSGRTCFGGQNLSQSFTMTTTEFKNILGWAVMDIESGSGDGSSNLPFTTITFAGNHVHDCNGSVALRSSASDRTDVVNIYGNTFSNIGGNQSEQGEHWAAFEINHADVANIYQNDVDDVAEGQWGEGQAAQLWDIGTVDMYDNSFTNCYQGIFIFGGSLGGPYGGPYAVPGGSIHDNTIAGNTQYGLSVETTATGGPLNAECNWWGSISGPYHATANGVGEGNSVSDNVDFEPWSNDDLSLCEFTSAPDTVWVDDDYNPTSAGGHTWGYDAFDNIQDGVDRVAASVVIVAEGTYVENIVIAKSLDLIGADSSTTTIDGNNVGNTVTITASNVTLSGFTVTGGWANGLDVFHPVGGVVVDGNSGDASLSGITIEGNIIDGNPGNGVYVSAAGHGGGASNVVIQDCRISNNGGANNAGISLTYPNYIVRPVGVWDEWKRPKNILVQGNTIYSNSSYGVYVSAGQDNAIKWNIIRDNSKYGLQLASSWNRTDIPSEYTTVDSNDIYDNVRNGVKLTSYNQYNTFTGNTIYNNGFGGTSDYYKYGFLFQDGNDNTIENNAITGNALGGLYLWGKGDPSYTWYSTTDNTITGNIICDHTAAGAKGIYIPVLYGNPNSGFLNSSINGNSITNNSAYGLENADATQTVDASGNWWGAYCGPYHPTTNPNGQGDEVSDDVDYEPWCDSTFTECSFTTTAPSIVWVDDDYTPLGTNDGHYWCYDAFDKIQDGVDVVAIGGTVNVAAGMYEEQVEIDKAVTLIGSGSKSGLSTSTIIKSPVSLTYYFTTGSNDNYPIVGIHDTTGVIIQDCQIDGAGRGNNNYRFCGIAFWNAGGSVIDCYVTGVRDDPFSGAQHGIGIYSYNNTGGPYTINVSATDVDDFQKNAMALSGDGLTANVSGCTVTGHGPTDVTAQNGIQISWGAGGTVTDCSVSGIAYTGEYWGASGMLFYLGTTVDVVGASTVSNSQSSIVFQGTNGSVDGAVVTTSGVNNEEGVSIRDYGYTKMSAEGLSFSPASPLEEVWSNEPGQKGAPSSVTLTNLNLTGSHEPSSYGVAAWAIGDDVTVTVTQSNIQDWEIGIVAYEEGGYVVDVTATSNNISSNDQGFWTNAASLQKATSNWWGDAIGPLHVTTNPSASGNEVSDNVDYSPWWGGNYVGDSHTSPWTWYVNTSNNSTVQEGIDAAASLDILRARPDTYVENIVVDKTLSLLGAGQDSVLVYPATSDIGMPNPEEGPSFRGSQICVVEATDVTIEGFTFDGDNPTLTPSGTIDARNGIITNYNTGDWSNLKMQNCTVRNIYLRGIYASAQTPDNLTGVDFNNNTVSNVKGVSMESVGIMLWGSSGEVKHNNVSDASVGIFYHWYSDGNMDSNTVTTSEVGLGVNSNDLPTSISHNSITDSDQGIQTVAVDAAVNVGFNHISACTSGVVLYGGGTDETNVWDNNIEGLSTYDSYGVWASTDLSPWGLGDLTANLKRNTIEDNFYGIVLNEPSGDQSKILSVLIGGAVADYNLIYNNVNYELLMEYCNDDQDATYNYWSYSSFADIEDEIFHQVDQASLGLVTFDPALLHGDVNLDGIIDLGDVLYLVSYLYKNGSEPQVALVADVNRDETLDMGDMLYLISYLYKSGPAPLAAPSFSSKQSPKKASVVTRKLSKPLHLRGIEK